MSDVLLVDTLGDLGGLYLAADAAFAGGSIFPKGGQSPLEPACARLPVVFGPSMENFHEDARALVAEGGAFQAADGPGVLEELRRICRDGRARAAAGEAAAATIRRKQGAVGVTLQGLKEQLDFL
jgi:3-deoxy-D-manno-octulosonic-acid transferase